MAATMGSYQGYVANYGECNYFSNSNNKKYSKSDKLPPNGGIGPNGNRVTIIYGSTGTNLNTYVNNINTIYKCDPINTFV